MTDKRAEVRGMLARWATAIPEVKRLERDRLECERLRDDIRDSTRISRNSGNSGGSGSGDISDLVGKVIERVDVYDQRIKQIDELIAQKMELRSVVDVAVSTLPEIQQQIVALRYKERKNWVAIGMQVYCSEGHAKRLEAAAVDALAERLIK